MPLGGTSRSHCLAMNDRRFSHTMEWQRLYSPCRPNNSRKDDIVQREHKLIVWLLNDGQGPVAEIARKRRIPRNRPYKWQKEVALHSGPFPGSGGQTEPAAELEPREREAQDARKGRGKIPSGFPLGKSEGDTEIIARPVPPWEWRKGLLPKGKS